MNQRCSKRGLQFIFKSEELIDRLRLKCDGTRAETRFSLWAKRTSPFKSAEASVQSTTGSRVLRISGSNAGYTMFRVSVKSTGHPLHSPVSPSVPSRESPCAITFQLDSTTEYLTLRTACHVNRCRYSRLRLYSEYVRYQDAETNICVLERGNNKK